MRLLFLFIGVYNRGSEALTMIPLVVAIILLSVSILVSRQFLLMKEWFLWACMLVGTFMRGEAESRKLKILKQAGRKHFRITVSLLPERLFRVMIRYFEKDLCDSDHSVKNYNRLVQGIALYDKDYSYLLSLIDDDGKREKA